MIDVWTAREETLRGLSLAAPHDPNGGGETMPTAWLRQLLGERLKRAPQRLSFVRDGLGKPRLSDSDLAFSLSHAGGQVAIAIHERAPVGVDIEPLASGRQMDELAPLVMSPRERRHLRALPAARRAPAQARLWSAKEACAKALGRGLSMDLRRLDVLDALDADAQGVQIDAEADRGVPAPLHLRCLHAVPGHALAVAAAVAGRVPGLRHHDLG